MMSYSNDITNLSQYVIEVILGNSGIVGNTGTCNSGIVGNTGTCNSGIVGNTGNSGLIREMSKFT